MNGDADHSRESDRGREYIRAREAAEEEVGEFLDRIPSLYVTVLARDVWAAGESLDRHGTLLPLWHAPVLDAVRNLGTPPPDHAPAPDERQLLLSLALVRLMWGEELLADDSTAACTTAMASAQLACAAAVEGHDEPTLQRFVRALRKEAAGIALGPGWSRRAKGLDVHLEDVGPLRSGSDPESSLDAPQVLALAKRIGTAVQTRALLKRIAGEPLDNSERQALHRLRAQLRKRLA